MKANFETAHRFFLGANTPNGFVSRMDQLTDPAVFDRVLILKGGPGSGKSTLLTRVAEAAAQAGHSPELICCSFDPGSLDAVSFGRTSIADGSPPHGARTKAPPFLITEKAVSEDPCRKAADSSCRMFFAQWLRATRRISGPEAKVRRGMTAIWTGIITAHLRMRVGISAQ